MKIYLTSEELALFTTQVAPKLQGTVEVVEEIIPPSAVETDDVLIARRETSPLLADTHKIQLLHDFLQPASTMQSSGEGGVDAETENELLFLNGVNGLTSAIKQVLDACISVDALSTLSQLTTGRHDLIEVNLSSLSPVSL